MELQEIETLHDLKEWVEDNLPWARITEDKYGSLVIHLDVKAGMGGELHPIGEDE